MTDHSFPTTPTTALWHPLVWAIVSLWFATVVALTWQGVFQIQLAGVPFVLALAAVVPPLLYLAAYRLSPAVRAWVAGLDMGLIVGAQTFRVIGIVFLILWGQGQLPSVFALTAGLGDLAVGLVALGVVVAVERRSAGWEGQVRLLVIVGMVDFVAAFATAILSGEGFPLLLEGEPLPVMMQSLPMALIPAFGVPSFMILHLMSLQKLPQKT
jgi:hypothetical protein